MTTGAKVALGIGAAAVAGGAIYIAYRNRQTMLAAQGMLSPVPVGITSIYSASGSMATANGLPISAAAIVGGIPIQIGAGSGPQSSGAFFAALAGEQNGIAPPPPPVLPAGMTTGPTTETRRGKGHF